MPAERFTVDPMAEGDIASVLAIEALAFPPKPDAPPLVGGESGHASEERLREELARAWSRLWVVRDGKDGVLAFLLAWHVADELHVLNVATHPDARRRGVATSLMRHAIDYSRAHAGRLILLEVRRSNAAAIALYRTMGFFAMNLRRKYYSDGEDAIEMALLMDPATGTIRPHADEVRIDGGV